MKTAIKVTAFIVALGAIIFSFGDLGIKYQTVKRFHVVTQGQTVWEIATMWQEKQDKRMTTGQFVHNIYKANKLGERQYIYPGDLLVIPLEMKAK